MARRQDDRLSFTSSDESLMQFVYGEAHTTGKAKRWRACPVWAVLGLLIHMIASVAGITISVLVIQLSMEVTSVGILDVVARILLFAASGMGIVYVFFHTFAARERFARSRGNQIYSYFNVATAVLTMRSTLPVWTGAVAMNAVVAAKDGFDVRQGIKGNAVWIQLLIAAVGLLSLILLIIIVETTDRPFATSIVSKAAFIKGTDKIGQRKDTFEMSVSRQGSRSEKMPKSEGERVRLETVEVTSKISTEHGSGSTRYDRTAIVTPGSSDAEGAPKNGRMAQYTSRLPSRETLRAQRERVRTQILPSPWESVFAAPIISAGISQPFRADRERVRSQYMPSPLESVFTMPLPTERMSVSPRTSDAHLTWRPPTRDSTFSQQSDQGPEAYTGASQPPRGFANPFATSFFDEEPEVAPRLPNVSMPLVSQPEPAADPVRKESPASPRGKRLTVITNLPPPEPASTPEPESTVSKTPTTPSARRAALPSLEKLSARAAARRRNSLLIREADLNAGKTLEVATSFSRPISAAGSPQKDEFVEIPFPDIALRNTPEDEEERRLWRPRSLSGGHDSQGRPRSLSAGHDSRPMFMRNFSRPTKKLGTDSSDGDEASGQEQGDEENDVRGSAPDNEVPKIPEKSRGRMRSRGNRGARRSKSLSNLQTIAEEIKRGTLDQVVSQLDGQQDFATPSSSRRRRVPRPKLSAFPQTTTEERKVKGLGQGSTRRLDERVTQWRSAVEAEPPRGGVSEPSPAEVFSPNNPPDVLDQGPGQPPVLRRQRSGGNKLSREGSQAARSRRAAQNF